MGRLNIQLAPVFRAGVGRIGDMTEEVATRLLEAIAANRLLVLCGAGLSMAAPSNLPSAAVVARTCADAYLARIGTPLEADIRTDIARMSLHFRDVGRFENFFISELVPWAKLKGPPNGGHEAIADLLACGALAGASTTNFDFLVEAAAGQLGEPDFRAVVDAGDLAQHTPHRPYLKLHGCEVRNRPSTIWCPEQLADAIVEQRLAQFRAWLAANLGGRDLVFIGFWSDWAYLTELLARHLAAVTPQHVYLVDPATPGELEAKAPQLWAWSHSANITFHHCPESGCDFLDELRRRWSNVYISRLMNDSRVTYTALFGGPPPALPAPPPAADSAALYALRRDLTGTPRTTVVRSNQPDDVDHIAGAIHQRLLERGATYSPHVYQFGGTSVRLVSGRGRLLSQVKAAFDAEPPFAVSPDAVVCAGSIADVSPAHIVRAAGVTTIVRPGALDNWTIHDALVAQLQGPHV